MWGTSSIGLAPTTITGVKEVNKPTLLTNFQEGPLIFTSIMTVFVKFRAPLYMRGTPGMGQVPIILRGAKYFIK